MRRTLPSGAAALVAAALLAACGSDDTTSSTSMGDHMSDDAMGDHMASRDAATPVVPGARRIEVTATSFAFDPEEITVSAGEDVALVLTSKDLLHDIVVDGIDAHVAAAAGDTEQGGLRADEPGRYTFYCSVPGHRDAGMEGTLIVE